MSKVIVAVLSLSLLLAGAAATDLLTASHAALQTVTPAIAVAAIAAEEARVIEPLLVSIMNAADILATSRSEVYQRIARGELDAVKDGARLKVTMESIRRYAASRPKATVKLYVPPAARKRGRG